MPAQLCQGPHHRDHTVTSSMWAVGTAASTLAFSPEPADMGSLEVGVRGSEGEEGATVGQVWCGCAGDIMGKGRAAWNLLGQREFIILVYSTCRTSQGLNFFSF